jgi:hypothetical protein
MTPWRFQRVLSTFWIAAVLVTGAQAAVNTPGRRIALVIGNSDYVQTDTLPRLANPANDAEDMARTLRGLGFEVIERKNQTLEAMSQSIAEFGSRIGGSEAALFYYAGHGVQVKNQNFLMPVNAKIDSDASIAYQGIDLNRVLDEMDNAKSAANIVILDACRNNPLGGKFRSAATRGLASPGNVPKGTVIVYATDPGNTAADGSGRNGIFTAGLLTAFKGPDLSLDGVLTVASAEVERATGNKQTPYINGPKTLQKNFNFQRTAATTTTTTAARTDTGKGGGSERAPARPALALNPYGKFFTGDGVEVEMAQLAQKNKDGAYDVLLKISGANAFDAGIDGKTFRYSAAYGGDGFDYQRGGKTWFLVRRPSGGSWTIVEVFLNGKTIKLREDAAKSKQVMPTQLLAEMPAGGK